MKKKILEKLNELCKRFNINEIKGNQRYHEMRKKIKVQGKLNIIKSFLIEIVNEILPKKHHSKLKLEMIKSRIFNTINNFFRKIDKKKEMKKVLVIYNPERTIVSLNKSIEN